MVLVSPPFFVNQATLLPEFRRLGEPLDPVSHLASGGEEAVFIDEAVNS